jgi:hypothetical protein
VLFTGYREYVLEASGPSHRFILIHYSALEIKQPHDVIRNILISLGQRLVDGN